MTVQSQTAYMIDIRQAGELNKEQKTMHTTIISTLKWMQGNAGALVVLLGVVAVYGGVMLNLRSHRPPSVVTRDAGLVAVAPAPTRPYILSNDVIENYLKSHPDWEQHELITPLTVPSQDDVSRYQDWLPCLRELKLDQPD
jgi:hypothetical protein